MDKYFMTSKNDELRMLRRISENDTMRPQDWGLLDKLNEKLYVELKWAHHTSGVRKELLSMEMKQEGRERLRELEAEDAEREKMQKRKNLLPYALFFLMLIVVFSFLGRIVDFILSFISGSAALVLLKLGDYLNASRKSRNLKKNRR